MLEEMSRLALRISVRTGLKEDTCLDLLLSGWAYRQAETGEPDRWVSTLGSITLPPTKI